MQMKTSQFIADLKKQPLRSVLKQIQYSVRDSRGENMIFLHELQRRKKNDNESQRNICGHKEKFLDNDQNQSASASDERNQIHEDNLLRLSLSNKNVENEQFSPSSGYMHFQKEIMMAEKVHASNPGSNNINDYITMKDKIHICFGKQ